MKASLFVLAVLAGVLAGGCGGNDGVVSVVEPASVVRKVGSDSLNYEISGGGFFSGGVVFKVYGGGYLRSDMSGEQVTSPIGFVPLIDSMVYTVLGTVRTTDLQVASVTKEGWEFGQKRGTWESFVRSPSAYLSEADLLAGLPEGVRVIRVLDVDTIDHRILVLVSYRSQSSYVIKQI
jgi:hypothetical protein